MGDLSSAKVDGELLVCNALGRLGEGVAHLHLAKQGFVDLLSGPWGMLNATVSWRGCPVVAGSDQVPCAPYPPLRGIALGVNLARPLA